MKVGNTIDIIYSKELSRWRLDDLVGMRGTIVEIQHSKDGTVYGCWVSLIGETYQGEKEWFIPQSAIGEWKTL